MFSIRKFVGRGALALTLSAAMVLVFAAQAGQAAKPAHHVTLPGAVHQQGSLALDVHEVAPSPQCTAATNAVKTWFTNDQAEDKSEKALNAVDSETGTDQSEDAGEKAALKALLDAAKSACGAAFHHDEKVTAPPTPACAAALAALKSALQKDQAEDQTEKANGTDDTPADQSEDQAEMAGKMTLWTAVKSACASTFEHEDHDWHAGETHTFGFFGGRH